MRSMEMVLQAEDGTGIFTRRWIPDGSVKALVQIVHGMAEHSARYKRLATLLCDNGIEVWASDHRGHGYTANLKMNSPQNGGLLGHCADLDGQKKVISDELMISERMHSEYSDLPLILFGHSWGSFIVQACIEEASQRYAACILSGTRGASGAELTIGAALAHILAFFKGRRFSHLLWNLSDGQYIKPFKPNRTKFDWLSRDTTEVDTYIADSLCGFPCSTAFYRDMFSLLLHIQSNKRIAAIRKDLPVLVFSGDHDPVGDMGKSPERLVRDWRKAGLLDIEFVLYPNSRHETLNELNKDEVMLSLLSFIKKKI